MLSKPYQALAKILLLTNLLLIVPVSPALAQTRDLQWYLGTFTDFLNFQLIPFFFALAILFLLVNVTKYFIVDGSDVSAHEEAKTYVLYAIIALVFLSSIWGIINLVTSSLGINNQLPVCPDYNQDCDDSGWDDDRFGDYY